MPLLILIVLAALEGVTAFWPVGTVPHEIILFSTATRMGLDIDRPEALRLWMIFGSHAGACLAVMLFCWRETGLMLSGVHQLVARKRGAGADFLGQVILACLPVAIAAYALQATGRQIPALLHVAGWATIGFAILLYLIDQAAMTIRRMEHLTHANAFMIGVAQLLALIPGASRVGLSITMGRFLGYERPDAARFALALGVPATAGVALLTAIEIGRTGADLPVLPTVGAAVAAFIGALTAMSLMMSWLERGSFTPFVVYRLVLGAVVLAFAFGL